ncbi:MAG: helix-turn-helix domain-containing protein [Anaerolineaceae bacterium]
METKEKILNSALKLFVKEGFSATTGSITKDAEVSAGILFHYFSTKNDLIIELHAKFLLEFYQAIVRLSRDSLISQLNDNSSFNGLPT